MFENADSLMSGDSDMRSTIVINYYFKRLKRAFVKDENKCEYKMMVICI